jgi:hypothetical protein
MVLLQAVQRYLESAFLSRARLITTINCSAPTPSTTMIAAEYNSNPFADVARLSNHELLEVHRSKISLHHAKSDYDYPTIHLPHSFSKLTGLPTRIYQTVHDGALAFLVVVSSKPTENASRAPKTSVFTRRRSPVRIRAHWFRLCRGLKLSLEKELHRSCHAPSFSSGAELNSLSLINFAR